MTILVIGQRGQLAQSLAAAASARGRPIFLAGRPQVDLLDNQSLTRIIETTRPSLVINAAAYTAVDRAETEPEAASAVNSQGVEQLGRACARAGVGLVHVSTDYVFDGRKVTPYVETDAIAPLGAYGRSKADGEELLRAVHPRHIIVRTAWVYSPYGGNFLKTMLRLGAKREQLSVVDDQSGNPTYAPHLAEALLDIATKIAADDNNARWGTYHAAGTDDTTWFGFAREIFAQAAERELRIPQLNAISTAEYPTPAKRPANSRLDCTRLLQTFGIQLPDWRQGTRQCVEQLLSGQKP